MDEQAKNLNQLLLAAMDAHARQTCFRIKRGRYYQSISYRRFQTLVFRLTAFFLHQGVVRVAIAVDNCLEWMAAYVACLLSGGAVVPLRPSLAPDMLLTILQDSGADLVVLGDKDHLQITLDSFAMDEDRSLPGLTTALVIGDLLDELEELPPGVVLMNSVLFETPTPLSEEQERIRSHAISISPQAASSIPYVIGETGRPKGAVFDHARSVVNLRHIAEWFTFEEDDVAFTVGSLSAVPHLAATLHYFQCGITNVVVGADDAVGEQLQQASPTIMLATPHAFERIYDEVMGKVARMPESSQAVFQWALAKGREYQAAGPDASPELRQAYTRADLTFFSQLRGQLGGRMRRLYSTGASLSQEVDAFFQAIGLPLLNVYSLTEAGGFPAISQPYDLRPGSCGQVAPGFEIRITDEGDVLVRGEAMMREYWQRPEETRQAVDSDGWLHSGDVGYLDEDGHLYITGRKQHLMVLSTGHKIAPTALEKILTASRFVEQAIVLGEGRPYVSALIVPDLEALATHLQEKGAEEGEVQEHTEDDRQLAIAADLPQVRAFFDEVIGSINNRLDRWEQIEEYRLIDPTCVERGDELVSALTSGDRQGIVDLCAIPIESMYPTVTSMEGPEVTQVQVEPERLRELLEKENMLDAWIADAGIEFLFELARDKQIDASSMIHICDAAVTIAQMESEEKPLSTALIVGNPVRIARVLPPSHIQLLRHDHIRRMRRILVTMAKIVDGLVLGYVVDKYGYVRGVHRLEVDLGEPTNLLLGPQFRHHAAISRRCDAVVFFVPSGGGQVRVFANGELVGRYANGDWSPDNISRVGEFMAQLGEQGKYDTQLVQRVLHCAFQMSEENLGAIFLLGDAGVIFERSDASEISALATFASADMRQLSDRELINFAKQDGATVIDVEGRFRGCMVLLRPRASTVAEIGPGKGARHSSAAKMSTEAQCLAITVSQDGPVTVYDCGQRILSL
jgi:long-chain acyl-CoA synthetase